MPTNQWAFMGRIHNVEATEGRNGGTFYKVTIHAAAQGDKGYPATIACKLGKSVATPPPAEGTPVAVSGMFGHYEGKDGRYFCDMIATELRPLAVGAGQHHAPPPRPAPPPPRPPEARPYSVPDGDVPFTEKNSDIPF